MPACAAFSISAGVTSGWRYSVMRNSVSGDILFSSALYATAASVDVRGGIKLGWSELIAVRRRLTMT